MTRVARRRTRPHAGLQRSTPRLQDNRGNDEVVATLAHELRIPLTCIVYAVHICRVSRNDAVRLGEELDVIERQVKHMTRLIEDLLAFKSDREVELRIEKVELRELLRAAAEAVRAPLEQRGHCLTIRLPPEPLYLRADPTRLLQVLLNLLDNAAKYTENGGNISVSAERCGGQLVVRIKDSGPGIPPTVLPRIFEMYARGETSKLGLGIGLSVVRHVIELHGGTISAESVPGLGAEFTIRLPAGAVSAEALADRSCTSQS